MEIELRICRNQYENLSFSCNLKIFSLEKSLLRNIHNLLLKLKKCKKKTIRTDVRIRIVDRLSIFIFPDRIVFKGRSQSAGQDKTKDYSKFQSTMKQNIKTPKNYNLKKRLIKSKFSSFEF